MVFNPGIPQIATVTSETLQQKIRELLPSQDGFGVDLAAQNVIVPIVDLTESAEGSAIGVNLQTALAFGSQTTFNISNTSTTIENTAGFYRIVGVATAPVNRTAKFVLSDGSSTKDVWGLRGDASSFATTVFSQFDLTVFLDSPDSLIGETDDATAFIIGSSRQIADSNGTLVNPSGFSPS